MTGRPGRAEVNCKSSPPCDRHFVDLLGLLLGGAEDDPLDQVGHSLADVGLPGKKNIAAMYVRRLKKPPPHLSAKMSGLQKLLAMRRQ